MLRAVRASSITSKKETVRRRKDKPFISLYSHARKKSSHAAEKIEPTPIVT